MDVRIVPLSPSTAPLLQAAAAEVLDHPVDPAQLAAFLADPRHLMLLAIDRGEVVVGIASGTELLHPDKPPQLFMNEVSVAPAHRKKGIGRRLVAALVAEARDRGCTYAWLGTAADNAAGQACFAAAAPDGLPEPFLLYEWNLAE